MSLRRESGSLSPTDHANTQPSTPPGRRGLHIEEIKDVQPEVPYLVGGHCFGSEVAFEIAQQLHAQGDEVALVALIGDNYLAPSAREGVTNTGSAYSLLHSLQRARFYIGRFPLGDIVRTTLHELNIRLNPRRKFTRRVYKAQLLARSRYVRKPYPGRALIFTASSSAPGGFSPFSLAGLVRGGGRRSEGSAGGRLADPRAPRPGPG